MRTARLELRVMRLWDLGFFLRLTGHAKVRVYLGGVMPVRTRVARFWSALWGRGCQWVVQDVSKRSLGLVGLTPHKAGRDWEVSYQFMPGAWGNGYATEAIAYLLDHAPVTRVIAETQVANGASCRLLERIGFVEEIRLVRFGAEQIIYARET